MVEHRCCPRRWQQEGSCDSGSADRAGAISPRLNTTINQAATIRSIGAILLDFVDRRKIILAARALRSSSSVFRRPASVAIWTLFRPAYPVRQRLPIGIVFGGELAAAAVEPVAAA